jgi:hypothetical protein
MNRWSRFALLLLLLPALLLTTIAAFADAPPPPGPMNIPRTSAPIVLDGDLSDTAWQQAAVIDKFYETSPADNIPAKVRTVAYVTYDSKYFYIGVRCDDPDPKKIRAPFVDRDAVIGTDDNIAVFLDTRNDKRSAMELRVNPRGIQGDGIFNDANQSEDFSPDFFYDTAARIDDKGWSAEFRIPFSSLRYDRGDPQTWNILVWRNYPRDFRYAFHSAPLPRGSNCLVCNTHPITGLTGLPAAGHLVAAPYVTAENVAERRATGPGLTSGDTDADAGLDVKWNPSANNAVDLTINPDFSQIEADVPQVTVNRRFAVFFPEKRPFFLEGFDFFDTPLNVAYTRTITSPRAGARITGKSGPIGYTVLVTEDRGGGLAIIPGPQGSGFAAQDFKSYATIGRMRRDFGASFVGAVFTDREISGGGHNRVLGPDFNWRPDQSNSVTAQLLYSDTKNPERLDLSPAWNGESLRSHAFTASWGHLKPTHDWFFNVRDIGDDFRADLGFIPQVGYREAYGEFGKRYFPEKGLIRFFRPAVTADLQTNRDGDTIFQQASVSVNGFGAKNFQYFVGLYPGERIRVGNELLQQTYLSWFLQYDPSRRLPRVSFQGRTGESIDFSSGTVGDGTNLTFTATMRPIDRIDLQLNASREWLDADAGRVFTETIERVRAQYSFSAKSLLRVIAQYDNIEFGGGGGHTGNFLGSVLYSYKLNWQTVLFLGYGDDRVILPNNDLMKTGRSLFFKVSYAYQR